MHQDRAWLIALRTRRGLTQASLADALGVDRKSIQRWESGAEPPARRHAIALDAFLGGASHRVLTELLREMRVESDRIQGVA